VTAAAVLIDATVVRGVLVPAALALLGDHAWQRRRDQAVKGGDPALVAAHP
jgi:RND superfamily putative drug exporter